MAEQPTSLQRLWRRFLKARGARVGLFLVAAFSAVAFLAPFLAHRLPFVWIDGETGSVSFPLVREFFAPSDTTESMLERGINMLFLFIPLALLAWRLMRRYAPRLARARSRLLSLLFGALLAGSLWLAIGGMIVQGGGDDWWYGESPPVPEIDDVVDAGAALAPPALPGLPDDTLSLERTAADGDAFLREVTLKVQDLIDGPALLAPAQAAAAGVDTHGITDANAAAGINTPRLNRFVVEQAWPGLLVPVRQFRSTFLAMAAVSLLTLLGLTYIFMAGAWQFALSPRWLVLLGLALLVAQPFRLPARHDHTPYRQLKAEDKGWGIFPLIPYGPNEQGFGPRLPPTWYGESPFFGEGSIRSWEQLRRRLGDPDSPAAGRVARRLAEHLPQWNALAGEPAGRPQVLAALNSLVDDDGLYDADSFSALRGDSGLAPYLATAGSLTAVQRQRLNRLLLERAAPGSFIPAEANRWKRPTHNPGYHLVGTDESGRDVLVRIIHGARVSLSVGFVSVFLATVIGLVMGSLAAYYGGKVDLLISRFLEVMMCFPSFFLILAVIAVLDKRSIVNIMLVIGLTSWTGVARLVRGEMLRQKKMDYVSASIALGASDTRTIFRHILPNAMAPVLVSISFGITGAILTEASLSFIGFGVTPPTPTWGQLLSETRDSPLANWWLAVFPGMVLFVSVLAYNMVGEALRDALDPRTAMDK